MGIFQCTDIFSMSDYLSGHAIITTLNSLKNLVMNHLETSEDAI